MFSIIPSIWERIWDKWNIHGVILFSLFLQILLILLAPLRKRTRSSLVSLVWFAYLLADWAADYCIGLISRTEKGKSAATSEHDYLMVFWGPFLLLHLGGPDPISAFALEDNELWLRHLLSLALQTIVSGYVFFLSFSRNTLKLPTILLFVAGLQKYFERVGALYVAAINNFRKSLIPDPDAGPNYAKLMEEYSSRIEAGLPAEITMVSELNQADYKKENHNSGQKKGDKKDKPTGKDPVEEVQQAYLFFQKFKGLIVDMIFSVEDRLKSQQYFKNIDAEKAFRVIEIELGFMYEIFYTKTWVVRQHWLWSLSKFFSLTSVAVAFGLFFVKEKHNLDKWDVGVTYALLYGALALDVFAFFMRVFTDYTATLSEETQIDSYGVSLQQKFKFYQKKVKICFFRCFNGKLLAIVLRWRRPRWNEKKSYKGCSPLSNWFPFRRWSGSISGHNLLKYCLDDSVRVPHKLHESNIVQAFQRGCFYTVLFVQFGFYWVVEHVGGGDLVYRWKYKDENPLIKELWDYIFTKLNEKSDAAEDLESISSARGEWALRNTSILKGKDHRQRLEPFVEPDEVTFDQSLLLWHVATNICYAKDVAQDKARNDARDNAPHVDRDKGVDPNIKEFSMLLSDYMLYLLVMQPTLMSAIAGIGQIRFQDTCAEAQNFFSKRNREEGNWKKVQKRACVDLLFEVPLHEIPSNVKGDRSKSLLFDACRLAHELDKLGNEKWEIIGPVWVELLSYAASRCRPTGHVQLLSKGGELISFVWLLMVQLGLGEHFQIKEGDARAKLIVGKSTNHV